MPWLLQVQALQSSKVSDALETSNVMAEESVALIKTVRRSTFVFQRRLFARILRLF